MKKTEDQFNEVRDKACQTIQGFIKNDDEQGALVANHYKDEIDTIYSHTIAELERVLANPPADNDKNSIFKREDCKNTKDSPDTAPASSNSNTTLAAPVSTPSPNFTQGFSNTTLASSVSTPSPTSTQGPSATVTPVVPPNTATPSCVPNPTTRVKDAHESELKKAVKFFCDSYANGTVLDPTVNIAQTVISGEVSEPHGSNDIARLYTGTQNEDDVYNFDLSSIDGCSTSPPGFNLQEPAPNFSCADLLYDAWKDCEFCPYTCLFLSIAFLYIFCFFGIAC